MLLDFLHFISCINTNLCFFQFVFPTACNLHHLYFGYRYSCRSPWTCSFVQAKFTGTPARTLEPNKPSCGLLIWRIGLALNSRLRMGHSVKLLPRYTGPYRILRPLTEVTYLVESIELSNNGRDNTHIIYIIRLKPYVTIPITEPKPSPAVSAPTSLQQGE